MVNRHCTAGAFLLALAVLLPAGPLSGQETTSILGRIFDAQTREPIPELSVTIHRTERRTVTDERGIFRFVDVPYLDDVILEYEHLAYGTQVDTVSVAGNDNTMLRISLAKEAIAMDPLSVEVLSEDSRRLRATGSSLSIISEEEIARLAPRSRGLEGILDQEIPGIRVSNRSSIPGVNICVEFRGVAKSLQDMDEPCHYPLMIMDGVRIDDGMEIEAVVSTLEPSDIHQIEMIPPAEAGVQYGTGSAYGVLVIDTKLRMSTREAQRSAIPKRLRAKNTYNWSLEPEGHPFYRTLAATTVGNALGLAAGIWAADQCMDFERLHQDFFHSDCGGLATAGSRIAALTLPLIGTTLGAHLAGDTRFSEGRWTTTAAMGAMALLPGYILAGTGFGQEGGSNIKVAGQVMLAVGVPLITTVANRLFRDIRAPEEDP